MAPIPKYRSSCHCKSIQFDFVAEERLEDRTFLSCNCTICTKNGYLNYYIPKSNITFISGADDLQEYSFEPHNRRHNFCPKCGTSLFIISNDKIEDNGKVGINVRSVDGLEVVKLKIEVFDGMSRIPEEEMKAWVELKEKNSR